MGPLAALQANLGFYYGQVPNRWHLVVSIVLVACLLKCAISSYRYAGKFAYCLCIYTRWCGKHLWWLAAHVAGQEKTLGHCSRKKNLHAYLCTFSFAHYIFTSGGQLPYVVCYH